MCRITEFHNHDVSLDNMSIDHRVAAYLEREGSGIFGELERVFIDRYATIGLLLLIRWIARRNHSQQGYMDIVSVNPSRRHGPRRSPASLNCPLLLQGVNLLMCGLRTRKSEVTLDFPKRRHDTL